MIAKGDDDDEEAIVNVRRSENEANYKEKVITSIKVNAEFMFMIMMIVIYISKRVMMMKGH